jgi:hypothetical protein
MIAARLIKKPRDGIASPPTGLRRLWRSTGLRTSQHASGFQRCCCMSSAPSGVITFITTLMARRYARWRIHQNSPYWLQPRRKMAHLLPSKLNVRRSSTCVKSPHTFSCNPEILLCERLFLDLASRPGEPTSSPRVCVVLFFMKREEPLVFSLMDRLASVRCRSRLCQGPNHL